MDITTIYFVRHAHAVWMPDENRPLSATGAADARTLATRLIARPISAIYSSPSRRAIETIAPLAEHARLVPRIVPDLRERALPTVPVDRFDDVVREMWASPERRFYGESHQEAQQRGVAVVMDILSHHAGAQVVIATHGNLLALMLNAWDSQCDVEFWRKMSFPDVYRASFSGLRFQGTVRSWQPSPESLRAG